MMIFFIRYTKLYSAIKTQDQAPFREKSSFLLRRKRIFPESLALFIAPYFWGIADEKSKNIQFVPCSIFPMTNDDV